MFEKPPTPSPPPLVVPHELAADLDAGTRREWLETNGLGSFAMGTVAGAGDAPLSRDPVRRDASARRAHGAGQSPEETVVVDGSAYALSTNFYPGVVHPEGYRAIVGFRLDPWPTWTLRAGGAVIERALFMPHGRQMTVVTWRLVEAAARGRARLFVRPLLSGRDYHALHHENDVLARDVDIAEGLVTMRPTPTCRRSTCTTTGCFTHKPDWYRRFQYPVERERGLD